MLYLLDANVLIDAHRDYYPIQRIPEFWDWLRHHGRNGMVKIPLEVYEEIRDAKGELGDWLRLPEVKEELLLVEEAEVEIVSRVVEEGYADDLTDDELEKLGRDPFLVAYVLQASEARCVVTTEASKPSRSRANRHLPDVCTSFGVRCVNTFAFARELRFSTRWEVDI